MRKKQDSITDVEYWVVSASGNGVRTHIRKHKAGLNRGSISVPLNYGGVGGEGASLKNNRICKTISK